MRSKVKSLDKLKRAAFAYAVRIAIQYPNGVNNSVVLKAATDLLNSGQEIEDCELTTSERERAVGILIQNNWSPF